MQKTSSSLIAAAWNMTIEGIPKLQMLVLLGTLLHYVVDDKVLNNAT